MESYSGSIEARLSFMLIYQELLHSRFVNITLTIHTVNKPLEKGYGKRQEVALGAMQMTFFNNKKKKKLAAGNRDIYPLFKLPFKFHQQLEKDSRLMVTSDFSCPTSDSIYILLIILDKKYHSHLFSIS